MTERGGPYDRDNNTKPDANRLYSPEADEAQLSFRAVIVGCLLGGVVTSMNMYLGLKIGWTVGGSLMAAILGYAFFCNQ